MTVPEQPSVEDRETAQLLERWAAGDHDALDAIVARERPWLEKRVRERLGDRLRAKAETQDFVQDALLEFLRYGPRFQVRSRRHLRGLLGRIVENALRGKAVWFARERRRIARERPLEPSDSLRLEPAAPTAFRPSVAADRGENEAWLRLALELLDPADREVLVLRQWDGLSFTAIAERLQIAEDAARMRFQRALPRLVQKMKELKSGDLESAFGDS